MKLPQQHSNQIGIVQFLPVFFLAFLVLSVALTMMLVQKKSDFRGNAGTSSVCQLSLPNTCTDFSLITDLSQLFRLSGAEWDIRTAIDALSADGSEEAMTMRGRSPINFTNRTEKITFTATTDFTTQNFVELWVTKDGIRYPQGEGDLPLTEQAAILVEFTFGGVGVLTYQNGIETQIAASTDDFQGTATKNKIDVELAANNIKVSSDGRLLIDTAINPPLNFTQGYANIVHGAIDVYCDPIDPNNPPTCTNPALHLDNAGYDGPQTTYSVVGSDENLIPFVQKDLAPESVTLSHPVGGDGTLWFSAYGIGTTNGQYRLNNGAWQTISIGADCDWYTYKFPASFVPGSNQVEFRAIGDMNACVEDTDGFSVHRVDLEAVTVPQSPTPTPTPQLGGSCTTTSTNFITSLSGTEASTGSTSTGITTMQLQANGSTLTYTITTNLTPNVVTAAHIHGPANPGVDAGILATLFSNGSGTFTNPYTNAVTVNSTTLSAMRTGNAYVNIHTNAFPNGEIRGQITCTNPGATPTPTVAPTATPTATVVPTATATPTPVPTATQRPGVEADHADVDHNGIVSARDLSILLGNWRRIVTWPQTNPSEQDRADVDRNGLVAARDLSILLGNWRRIVTW